MKEEQRKFVRRDLSYYLPVAEAGTKNRVGVITDISQEGFKLEAKQPIPEGEIHRLRVDLNGGTGPLNALVLVGRSKWCQSDFIDPSSFDVGFEIVDPTPEQAISYQRLFEEYSEEQTENGYRYNRNYYPWS
jgi:hypothetical protein